MNSMRDEIVNPDDYNWDHRGSSKGQTKYRHLLDGQARKIDIRDYGYTVVENFRVMITATARNNGLKSRSMKLDNYTLLFQVTGKRESERK
jgi:hypothetical protein